MEMQHGTDRQSDPRKPHHHRRFPQRKATYGQLLDDTKAFVECVLAFLLSTGFQLLHKASCSASGRLTRHSHYARVRLGGLTIWRVQCTTCKAVRSIYRSL